MEEKLSAKTENSAERQRHVAAAAELEKNAAPPPVYTPPAVPDMKPSSSSAQSERVNWGLVGKAGAAGATVGTAVAIANGPVGWFTLGMGSLLGAWGAGAAIESEHKEGKDW